MVMKARGTNISLELDSNSIEAYVLSAVIGRQIELNETGAGRSHIHYNAVGDYLKRTYQDLEINENTVVDALRALANKRILTINYETGGNPSYKLNLKFLEESG